MGKVNLIDQLRKHSSGSSTGSGKYGNANKEPDVEFEDASGSDSELDANEKRRVVMLLIGIFLVLGARQVIPFLVSDKEAALHSEASVIDQKIAVEQKKAQGLKLVQEEMRQYDSRVSDLKAKLQKVQQLDEDRNLLVRMTDYIVKEMPQRLWFDSIDVDTNAKVKVSGYSSNYQVVSDFMKKLEGAIYFPNWKLLQTENPSPSSAKVATDAKTNSIEIPLDAKRFELEAQAAHL